ncbi:MAG: helix-turn-helix domain-containing protein [Ruminococcaceae bacterium]|nr:helix-turn-helix domain-containing protein [Oscillospiraceae bacterium]
MEKDTQNSIHSISGSYQLLAGQEPFKLCIKRSTPYISIDNLDIEDSHIHDVYEIYINISGDVSFLYNSNVYKMEKGDIIFSAPGDIHHCIFHSTGIHDHYCIWFSLPRNSCVAEYVKEKKLCGFVHLSASGQKKIFELAQRLDDMEIMHDFEKNICFFSIIEQLSLKETVPVLKNETVPKQIVDILEYIEKNFAEIRCVEEVAAEFYMSVTSLNRNFRKYISLSPYKFLMAKRLSHAEKMLRQGGSVTGVCYACGFRDCSRFIEHFKKRYGMTPMKYKSTLS